MTEPSAPAPEPTSPIGSGDYFLEIEAYFAEKRGTPFILSAKDYSLMQKWSEEGIPLAVVLEAIGRCFEKAAEPGRRRTISSLSYCRHSVKDLWEERRDLSVGGEGHVPERDPLTALQLLAGSLRDAAPSAESLSAAFMEEAAAVEQLGTGRSVPEIEEALIAREDAFLTRIVSMLPPGEQEKIEDEVAKAIGSAGKLDESIRLKTADANRRRLVRKRFGVPRFSLFG